MSHIALFCPTCSTYWPAGFICPGCGRSRGVAEAPVEPAQPLWRVELPGAPALRPALAHIDGRNLLLLPWGNRERGDGGVVALDTANGSATWEAQLDMPVEGGVAVAEAVGVAVVGLSRRGHFSSEGAITALDLRTGHECWPSRVQVGGAAEAAPVTDGVRAYVAADDGQLYCLDVASGRLVWKKAVVDKPVRIPAPPALLIERGIAQAIVVATYGVTPWQDDGQLVAFDAAGRRIWVVEAGGQVRGAPVIAKGRVVVAAYRGGPVTGVLSAFDLRTARPVWPESFTIPAPANGRSDIVAAPLVAGDAIYVGSHDHRLYAVDIATGKGCWSHEVPRGIVSAPTCAEGLVVFGANNGALYAVDAATGERAWEHKLGGHLFTGPLVEGGFIFAAADNGEVAALPWHSGRYAWAAARLEAQGRCAEAGDCWALAGHVSGKLADQEAGYRRAAASWYTAEVYERAAEMWTALSAREARWRKEAANAWREAGLVRCGRDPVRAATYLKRAADLYLKLRLAEPLNECTQALAECAHLPFVAMHVLNPGSFVQWEASQLELRLTNEGASSTVGSVWLELGGGLKQFVTADIPEPLPTGESWRVPLTVTPVQLHSTLQIEIAYDSGIPAHGILRGLMVIPVDAAKQARPIIFRDAGQVVLAGQTAEGVNLSIAGDVASIIARSPIGKIQVNGDVGLIKGVDSASKSQIEALIQAVNGIIDRFSQVDALTGARNDIEGQLADLSQMVRDQRINYARLHERLAGDARRAMEQVGSALDEVSVRLTSLEQGQRKQEADLHALILQGFAQNERSIVAAVLDAVQHDFWVDLRVVLAALQAGNDVDKEWQGALHDLQLAVAELHRRTAELPASVADRLTQMASLTTGTQLDVKHKLVAEAPIIPFVLTYQAEFELEDGLKLAELWRRVVAKVRGRQ